MFFDVPHLLFHGHYNVISTPVAERGTGTDCKNGVANTH